MITDQQFDQIDKLFEDQLPEYFEIVNTNKIRVKTDQSFLRGTKDNWHNITFDDILKYFSYEVNSMSGLRQLGTIAGDWRNINDLAEQCIEIFKILKPKKFLEGKRKTWIDNRIGSS